MFFKNIPYLRKDNTNLKYLLPQTASSVLEKCVKHKEMYLEISENGKFLAFPIKIFYYIFYMKKFDN